ncbi:MAG: zinc-binding alcohol dehydrogenase family protein [Pseudonocardiales bacterium]|nr:zinc-binding alcohol dehydrogenase family protein [Pseudonocardiales bacterium]
MKAAVLTELGAPPQFADFPEPHAVDDQVVVEVAAAAVNHVDLAKASGTFYTGPPPLPSVVGSDGVGHTPDGRRVFFDASVPPYGSWAQRSLVARTDLLEPAEGIDDVRAAAVGNTGLAAWLALSWRAKLQPGESVLVLGANGSLGSIAVQAAKVMGAGFVIATDRDPERLERLRDRGADAIVTLTPDGDLTGDYRAAVAGGVDVIIDPLWGAPALAAMRAAAHGARLVQLGHLAGTTLELPAPTVRSAALHLLGMAVFHAPLDVRRESYLAMTEKIAEGAITVDVVSLPLSDVAAAWERQRGGPGVKLVLTP